ncbi:MAG: ABC transporter ATP-binding protein [Deltaproteobacteria bacterium]|nr:ABC transporter ATP-binding protein [Deltaproteobacteria bacterium]
MGIIVEHVSKSYEGTPILSDISLEIKDGEFVTFLAPTGEGKTTLLRIIAGVETPDSGRIYYNDVDVTDWPVQKKNVAMVYQWFVNYPSLTVYENIATPLRVLKQKLSRSQLDQRVRETAALLKIDGLLDHHPSELSGGQQQRLAIARSLAKRADYVFLDEPLTNLDYKLQEELRAELKNIFGQKAEGAVIFATPQPIEALALSTQVGFLHNGRLLQFGPVDDVYHKPLYMEVGAYFSHPEMNIFKCALTSENGHQFLKATDQLKLAVDAFQGLLTDSHYMVGIRAHALSTERESEKMIPIKATVELGEVVGSDTELHIDHQGISLVSLLQGMGGYDIGQEITVYLNPERFFIFDESSGKLVGQTHVELNR